MIENYSNYGIRAKLLATMIGLIVCLLTILTTIQVSRQKKIVTKEQEARIALRKEILIERGKTLTSNLSRQVENDLAVYNVSNISEVLHKAVTEDRELAYCILMDSERVAHIYTNQPELQQQQLNSAAAIFSVSQAKPATNAYTRDGESFIEFIVPLRISTEPWGVLRLGYSLNILNEEILSSRQAIAASNQEMVLHSILISFLFVGLGAGIVLYISGRLSKPLTSLTESVRRLEKGNFMVESGIYKKSKSKDEVGVLSDAFIQMSQNLKVSYEKLEKYNRTLEQKVEERTQDLKEAFDELKKSQERLVESEKMASLGQLVAGVAHEINTPVGIGVTVSSHLGKAADTLTESYERQGLKKSELESFLREVKEDSELILKNLLHTADLIRSFKMVSADQISRERRTFSFRAYLDDIILSLEPKLKTRSCKIEIMCPDDLELDSYPGVFGQIVTNLVVNTLTHGYDGNEKAEISIAVSSEGNEIIILYKDQGKGIPEENMKKIFDPFFTTRRGTGENSGLGLHIVYNLIIQTFQGTITCDSVEGNGCTFAITIPNPVERA